jgi:hypothetical protein
MNVDVAPESSHEYGSCPFNTLSFSATLATFFSFKRNKRLSPCLSLLVVVPPNGS